MRVRGKKRQGCDGKCKGRELLVSSAKETASSRIPSRAIEMEFIRKVGEFVTHIYYIISGGEKTPVYNKLLTSMGNGQVTQGARIIIAMLVFKKYLC